MDAKYDINKCFWKQEVQSMKSKYGSNFDGWDKDVGYSNSIKEEKDDR